MSIVRNPLVSIVIPSWQQGKYIRSAIESIISQSYSPIEIIVQDNLSSDGTSLILNEFRNKIHNIYIERDNGQSDAINKGFRRSKGEILGWLNADDMLMPNAIKNVVDVFLSTDEPQIVYGQCANLNEFGQLLNYSKIITNFSKEVFINTPNLLAQTSTFFLRDSYFDVGGLNVNLKYTMDWDLWCRFAKNKCHFILIDDVLSGARIYADTKSKQGGLKRLIEIYHVNKLHKTTILPLATAMYFYLDFIKPKIKPIRPLVRQFVHFLCLQKNAYFKPFFFQSDNKLTRDYSEFLLKYPVYSSISGTQAIIYHPSKDICSTVEWATLNEMEGRIKHINNNKVILSWKFEKPVYFYAIEIKFKLNKPKLKNTNFKFKVEMIQPPQCTLNFNKCAE